MPCESIRPVIHTFLDNLLDEKDYQNIQFHLEGCASCRAYASSVGTLSYRLYELGEVSVPPDMSSTVLYEFEKHRQAVPVPPMVASPVEKIVLNQSSLATQFFWLAVLVILAGTVIAVVTIVSLRRVPKELVAAVTPTVSVVTTPVTAPGTTVSIRREGSAEGKPKEGYAHWHYHISKSSYGELKQIFQDLYLTVLDESPSHLVFFVPKDRMGKFMGRIEVLHSVVKEFGEMDPSSATDPVQVSIYLE